MISVSDNFLVESEWFFTAYYLSLPSTRYYVLFNRQSAYLCDPLLADLFLYSHEADFIQGLLKKTEKKLA
jgi:hypothetical protein